MLSDSDDSIWNLPAVVEKSEEKHSVVKKNPKVKKSSKLGKKKKSKNLKRLNSKNKGKNRWNKVRKEVRGGNLRRGNEGNLGPTLQIHFQLQKALRKATSSNDSNDDEDIWNLPAYVDPTPLVSNSSHQKFEMENPMNQGERRSNSNLKQSILVEEQNKSQLISTPSMSNVNFIPTNDEMMIISTPQPHSPSQLDKNPTTASKKKKKKTIRKPSRILSSIEKLFNSSSKKLFVGERFSNISKKNEEDSGPTQLVDSSGDMGDLMVNNEIDTSDEISLSSLSLQKKTTNLLFKIDQLLMAEMGINDEDICSSPTPQNSPLDHTIEDEIIEQNEKEKGKILMVETKEKDEDSTSSDDKDEYESLVKDLIRDNLAIEVKEEDIIEDEDDQEEVKSVVSNQSINSKNPIHEVEESLNSLVTSSIKAHREESLKSVSNMNQMLFGTVSPPQSPPPLLFQDELQKWDDHKQDNEEFKDEEDHSLTSTTPLNDQYVSVSNPINKTKFDENKESEKGSLNGSQKKRIMRRQSTTIEESLQKTLLKRTKFYERTQQEQNQNEEERKDELASPMIETRYPQTNFENQIQSDNLETENNHVYCHNNSEQSSNDKKEYDRLETRMSIRRRENKDYYPPPPPPNNSSYTPIIQKKKNKRSKPKRFSIYNLGSQINHSINETNNPSNQPLHSSKIDEFNGFTTDNNNGMEIFQKLRSTSPTRHQIRKLIRIKHLEENEFENETKNAISHKTGFKLPPQVIVNEATQITNHRRMNSSPSKKRRMKTKQKSEKHQQREEIMSKRRKKTKIKPSLPKMNVKRPVFVKTTVNEEALKQSRRIERERTVKIKIEEEEVVVEEKKEEDINVSFSSPPYFQQQNPLQKLIKDIQIGNYLKLRSDQSNLETPS